MEVVVVLHSSIQSQMEKLLCSPNSWTLAKIALNIFKENFVYVKRGLASFDTGNSVAPQGYTQAVTSNRKVIQSFLSTLI